MIDRMKAWKALPSPKMSWEEFKRMMPVFNDELKALMAWRKKNLQG
tara:strand:+ start:219 stop:356 length:138 start_codon:yes stop_codon:yes gene_type:complete